MKLHLLCGIPGSGKSTLTLRIPGYVVSTDSIRKFLWDDESNIKHDRLIFSISEQIIDYMLRQGRDVIFDATNLAISRRKIFITMAKKYRATIVLHWVKCPLEESLRRNSKRARKVPEQIIRSLYKSFQEPHNNEGIDLLKIYNPNLKPVVIKSRNRTVKRSKVLPTIQGMPS